MWQHFKNKDKSYTWYNIVRIYLRIVYQNNSFGFAETIYVFLYYY